MQQVARLRRKEISDIKRLIAIEMDRIRELRAKIRDMKAGIEK
jgi:hypothetical protein